jgi:hypothetical protein
MQLFFWPVAYSGKTYIPTVGIQGIMGWRAVLGNWPLGGRGAVEVLNVQQAVLVVLLVGGAESVQLLATGWMIDGSEF